MMIGVNASTLRSRYDYIIVGAGAAGCVLASRLSEDRATSVLLVERGPTSNSLLVDMPAAVGSAIRSGRFSESLLDEQHGQGGDISQIQGRAVGGSSAINGMMYVRGNQADYDGWAKEGCLGWSYADVLPYFLRAEGHQWRGAPYHGATGPLRVSTPDLRALSSVHHAFLESARQAGLPETADFNGAQQEGASLYDRTTFNGTRCSADRAYLRPHLKRLNLDIAVRTTVHSIEFEGNRAVAIRTRSDTETRRLEGGEIIVSAGGFRSPQLLMLSGIGPEKDLRTFGIKVRADLPGVGANLQNHPDVAVQFRTNGWSLYKADRFPAKHLTGLRWLLGWNGLGSSNHYEVGAFVRSAPELENPDLQLTLFNLALIPGSMQSRTFPGCQVHLTLVKPESRGRVSLRSNSADDAPIIRLNYLSEPRDLQALISGVKIVRDLGAQPAFRKWCEEIYPGRDIQSDSAIEAWIREALSSFFHPAGTCRMGRPDDPASVVDGDLKVLGVSNLRVVDASIMPVIPAGNTYAPTVMIAEKAADLIKGAN